MASFTRIERVDKLAAIGGPPIESEQIEPCCFGANGAGEWRGYAVLSWLSSQALAGAAVSSDIMLLLRYSAEVGTAQRPLKSVAPNYWVLDNESYPAIEAAASP